jgi:hypothetical protein
MKMSSRFYWMVRIIMLLGAVLPGAGAMAQDEALPLNSIHLKSRTPVVNTGETFTVEVMVNAGTPAYGFGFQLEFDPGYLEVVEQADTDTVSVAAPLGTLFQSAQRVKNGVEQVGNSQQIDVVYTLLPPAEAAQGTGTLVSVSFQVLKAGATQLRLLNPRLIALNGEVAQDIPLTIVNPTLLLDVTAAGGTINPVRILEPVTLPPAGMAGLLMITTASVLFMVLLVWRNRRRLPARKMG